MAVTETRSSLGAVWHRAGPVLTVLVVVLLLWHAAAVWLNAPQVIERTLSSQPGWGAMDLLRLTLSMDRPVLPAPHQIALDLVAGLGGPRVGPRRACCQAGFTFGCVAVDPLLHTLP